MFWILEFVEELIGRWLILLGSLGVVFVMDDGAGPNGSNTGAFGGFSLCTLASFWACGSCKGSKWLLKFNPSLVDTLALKESLLLGSSLLYVLQVTFDDQETLFRFELMSFLDFLLRADFVYLSSSSESPPGGQCRI